MSGTEKETYRIPKFSGKRKDYYRWSRLFLSYAELRKYDDVLRGDTEIPDTTDSAVKQESGSKDTTKIAEVLTRAKKAKSELLTAVEKSSICFLRVSHAKNARYAWLALKERYEPSTVAEELRLVKKFNAMKLNSVRKNPVERFCIPLELVRARLLELGMEIPEKHFMLQVLGNLPKEYDIQCQVMRIELSAGKLNLQSMYDRLEMRYDDLTSTKTSRKNGRRKSAFSDSDSDSANDSGSGTEDAMLATPVSYTHLRAHET